MCKISCLKHTSLSSCFCVHISQDNCHQCHQLSQGHSFWKYHWTEREREREREKGKKHSKISTFRRSFILKVSLNWERETERKRKKALKNFYFPGSFILKVSLDWDRQREKGKIFFRVNFVGWFVLGVHSTPVLPQWHVKDPSHSAKSAGDRLHLNMHTPLTQRSQSGLTMPLSRHSVGTYPETSSHTTCHWTFSHSHLSLLSHCGLLLAYRVELVRMSST